MLVLSIDTTLSACSAAVVRDGEVLAACSEAMERGHAERLAPMVDELARQAGLAFADLDRIAVTTGPGAFTGLRIGLAFARGLALALERPCIGVSTLEALAAGSGAIRAASAITMAGSLFVGAWEGRREVLHPARLEVEEALAALDSAGGDWRLTGPGAAVLSRLRPDWPVTAQDFADPVVLAGLAMKRTPQSSRPDPLYLRGADAKLPRGLSPLDAP